MIIILTYILQYCFFPSPILCGLVSGCSVALTNNPEGGVHFPVLGGARAPLVVRPRLLKVLWTDGVAPVDHSAHVHHQLTVHIPDIESSEVVEVVIPHTLATLNLLVVAPPLLLPQQHVVTQ